MRGSKFLNSPSFCLGSHHPGSRHHQHHHTNLAHETMETFEQKGPSTGTLQTRQELVNYTYIFINSLIFPQEEIFICT